MDRVALEILTVELRQDATVVADAVRLARVRLEESHDGHLEACGFELQRLYNVLEKAFERVCTAFENHFDKQADYHERLIQRMVLEIPGVRPAFLPRAAQDGIRELKAFRHVFRHAYELRLRKDRLAELVSLAENAAAAFPTWSGDFVARVKAELPPSQIQANE
jgi:hypothetical protein